MSAGTGLELKRVCVFCGSHNGVDPAFRAAAVELGRWLAEHGVGLVYGGGRVGLMGAMADAALAANGEVIGVIPRALRDREVAHLALSDLQVVDSMHERKRLMYGQAEAFAALPGGIGTLDELFEAMTWNQLDIHAKPAGLLNVEGYFDPLIAMLERAVEQGFVGSSYREFLRVAATVPELMAGLERYRPPAEEHWSRRSDVPTDAVE